MGCPWLQSLRVLPGPAQATHCCNSSGVFLQWHESLVGPSASELTSSGTELLLPRVCLELFFQQCLLPCTSSISCSAQQQLLFLRYVLAEAPCAPVTNWLKFWLMIEYHLFPGSWTQLWTTQGSLWPPPTEVTLQPLVKTLQLLASTLIKKVYTFF